MPGKILVTGATGNVGTVLVRDLVASGEKVKAASRGGTPVAGAEAVRFDQGDPSTYAAAFDDVDRAYFVVPNGYHDITGYLFPLIRAAAERKVKVVLQSALGADASEDTPYRQAELFLERGGTPFAVIRPTFFSDNFHLHWIHSIKAQGMIAVPAEDGKTGFIDVRDIAASAAAALRSDRFNGKAFNLTGPAALTYHDAADILSKASGTPIRYQPIDDQTFIGHMTSAGVPADDAAFLASIYYPVRRGWVGVVTGDVETLTGKVPRSLQTYAADHAAKFKN